MQDNAREEGGREDQGFLIRALGYETKLAFICAQNDWIRAHNWAFKTYVQVSILLHGRVDPEYIKDPPDYLLFCHLDHSPTPIVSVRPADRNPSETFTLRRTEPLRYMKVDAFKVSDPLHAEAWEQLAAEQELTAREARDRWKRAYVTTVPVIIVVEEVSQIRWMHVPVVRTHTPLPRLNIQQIAILEDVELLCRRSLTSGCSFPLRCLQGLDRSFLGLPLPGRFVKDKIWLWEPLFADWDEYSPASGQYEDLHAVLKDNPRTKLGAEELLLGLLNI